MPTAYQELHVCWVPNRPGADPDDHDHDWAVECYWGWACNQTGCGRDVHDEPCPEHAPLTPPPGLRLVDCTAEPRHWLFAHDRDDYGHGCPWCWSNGADAELAPLEAAAGRWEHRWCWLYNPVKRLAVAVGIARRWGISSDVRWGISSDVYCYHTHVTWRWSR